MLMTVGCEQLSTPNNGELSLTGATIGSTATSALTAAFLRPLSQALSVVSWYLAIGSLFGCARKPPFLAAYCTCNYLGYWPEGIQIWISEKYFRQRSQI